MVSPSWYLLVKSDEVLMTARKTLEHHVGEQVADILESICGCWECGDMEHLLTRHRPEDVVVFIASYTDYDYLEKLAQLDSLGYCRTGSNFGGTSVANHKLIMGAWFASRGLRIARKDNTFPCVLKRADSCGSYDNYVVHSEEEFNNARAELTGSAIVVEPFVVGDEYSVNFINGRLTTWYRELVGRREVMTKERKLERAKWTEVHGVLGEGAEEQLKLMPEAVREAVPTMQAFVGQLGLSDIVRIDVRVCEATGRVHVMDVNNVACCNYGILTAEEVQAYKAWLLSLAPAKPFEHEEK